MSKLSTCAKSFCFTTLLGMLLFSTGCGTAIFTYSIGAQADLDEIQALELSRRAIADAGLEAKSAVPVAFDDDESPQRFFVKNVDNPNDGQILWKVRRDFPGRFDYSVHLERVGSTVTCRVVKAK